MHHTLRWGLIGAGSISSDWAKSLQKVPGAVLSSVAARDSAKAAAFAEKHGVKSVSPSYQELVASPEVRHVKCCHVNLSNPNPNPNA